MVSLSGTADTTTGKGDDPSPTTATGPNELIEVAPLTALREPAIMRAARAANISFLAFFTEQPPSNRKLKNHPVSRGVRIRLAHFSNTILK